MLAAANSGGDSGWAIYHLVGQYAYLHCQSNCAQVSVNDPNHPAYRCWIVTPPPPSATLISNVVVETGYVDGVHCKYACGAVSAENRAAWSDVKTLTAETPLWGDRDYVQGPIPAEMTGAEFIWRDSSSQYDEGDITFTLSQPATVWFTTQCSVMTDAANSGKTALEALGFTEDTSMVRMDLLWAPGQANAGCVVSGCEERGRRCTWSKTFGAATVSVPSKPGGQRVNPVIAAKAV